jgi:hypothetical protein
MIIAKNRVIDEYENTDFLSSPTPKDFKLPSLSISHLGFLKKRNKQVTIYINNKY